MSIHVFETGPYAVFDSLLDLLLDETGGKRLESLVQEIVLRIPDRELERSDLGVNGFNLEYRRVVYGRRDEFDIHVDTFATEDDVGQAGVPQLWETGLFPEVEGDVAKVCLNLAEGKLDLVFRMVVDHAVGRKFEVVLGSNVDDVGEQVFAREREILNDEVEGIVCILDAWNGNVADLTDDGWEDNFANISPQVALELQRALTIEKEILRETSPVLAKTLVQRIFPHLLEPVSDGLKRASDVQHNGF